MRRAWNRRRSLATVATAALLALLPGSAIGAPVQSAPAVEACTLRPSTGVSAKHEWLSCLRVDASLSRAPAVGETATVTFEVLAQYAREGVRVEATLPANLRWVKAPAGMATVTRASAAPQAGGTVHKASTVRSLAGGEVARFEGTVVATSAGPAEIAVRALAPRGGGNVEGADDRVFVTVGKSTAASAFGFADRRVTGTRLVGAATEAKRLTPRLRHRPVPAPSAPVARTAATACVSGSWSYVDPDGITRPSANFRVDVYDFDGGFLGSHLIASGVTGADGTYLVCFDNTDEDGTGQDPHVTFVADNGHWSVEWQDVPYFYGTLHVNDVADGSTTSFGARQPTDPTHMRGLHAFDAANSAWLWKPGSCWDANDTTCRKVVINWAPDSTIGNFYSLGGNEVHLQGNAPDSRHTVIHEVGHSVMDDIYEDAYPSFPNCSPHFIQSTSSTGCAWTEGFAEWFPASVLDDPFYRWPSGAFLNLETPTRDTAGWDDGDAVEGRVAGTMIDISDSASDWPYDVYGEGDPGNQWTTFLNHVSNTYLEYWGHRGADGFDVSSTGAGSSAYQNTIDYNPPPLFTDQAR